MHKNRLQWTLLPSSEQKTVVLLTGARQTGKTTLAKEKYPKLHYINFDAIEEREKIKNVSTFEWSNTVGKAILDEVQKEPEVLEKVKHAFDDQTIDFSVLLGSSQILLLKRVRESLAGRISIYELYPLMMSEIAGNLSPLISTLLNDFNASLEKTPKVLFGSEESDKKQAQEFLLKWGGMPSLVSLPEEQRRKWIKDYEFTYLERDLADLARLSDLQPFRRFQQIAAMRSSQLLNYSELARDTGVSVDTARRYLEYLKLSYQVMLLQPYFKNGTTSLVKTPKIYWIDIGIWRQLSGFRGEMSGQLFETMVVSELYKWIKTAQEDVNLYFYRTTSGLEVDLILETPQGIIGIEIKSRDRVVAKDLKGLKEVAKKLKTNWVGGLVIYSGEKIEDLGEYNIWTMPAWRLLT